MSREDITESLDVKLQKLMMIEVVAMKRNNQTLLLYLHLGGQYVTRGHNEESLCEASKVDDGKGESLHKYTNTSVSIDNLHNVNCLVCTSLNWLCQFIVNRSLV